MGLWGKGVLKLRNTGKETRKQKGSNRQSRRKKLMLRKSSILVPKRKENTSFLVGTHLLQLQVLCPQGKRKPSKKAKVLDSPIFINKFF